MTFTYLFSQVKYFITWFRKFTLCKASKNATNCVETETPKWTWDMWQKDFDPSLHKNMSPFWWTKKRGLFLPPSLPYGPMSPSQQFFFFECFPYRYTVVEKSLLYFVLLYYSHKSWSIFKTRDRFGICWSWRFQNTPYMSNLTKFWLRYLRLKTHDTILLFSCYLIWLRRKLLRSEDFVLMSID